MLKTMHLFEHLCPLEWRESTLHRSVYLCLWSALELSEPQISVVKWCSRCARTWRCACDAPEGWGEASDCCWSWCWCSGATGSEGGCGSAGVWTGCSCRWAARWSRPDRSLWVPAGAVVWFTVVDMGGVRGWQRAGIQAEMAALWGLGRAVQFWSQEAVLVLQTSDLRKKKVIIKLTFATCCFFFWERNLLFLSARTSVLFNWSNVSKYFLECYKRFII